MCSADIFLGVIAILFPPLAVWVKCGLCSADSVINILLCFLGYLPGLFHAWYIIAKFPEADDYERVPQDYESGGRVTYVYVQAPQPHQQPQSQPQPQQQPKHGQPMNYGTASASAPAPAGSSSSHQGSSSNGDNNDRAPPTYAEAVKGDHKIQSDE
ncbi:hypothetical protein GGS24DRAFT_331829 [Hypoxylon argillaceum]|nr:hypothetical protein GGS24DRAFT_331829 [Hypoxylon argillaceum]